MATRTAQSGLWSDPTTWGGTVPVNGDAFNIPVGVVVKCDVDQSSMATGMAASVIDGLLHFDADTNTCLKMNGNITGTGALYICERATVTGWTLTTDKTHTYQVSRSLDVATVEDTLGAGYLDAVEELIEVAIDTENAARRAQGLNEMMPDAVQDFIETTKASLTLSQILTYVEATQGSFYHDTTNDVLYIHTSDSTDPAGKTITVIEPINRPAASSEYRAYLLFNSTGTIAMTGTPVIRMYGWYPEREWTQLAADAASGQNQIVLEHDLGLQAGDRICISSSTENGVMAESLKGIYTVSMYASSTKTATLTANLQSNRKVGDYVAWVNRPIKINRTSGDNSIITTKISNPAFIGVNFIAGGIQTIAGDITNCVSGFYCDHCTCQGKPLVNGATNSTLKNSLVISVNYGLSTNSFNSLIENCISINSLLSYTSNLDSRIHNAIIRNAYYVYIEGVMTNCDVKNTLCFLGYNCTAVKNSVFNISETYETSAPLVLFEFIDCVFEDNIVGYFRERIAKLFNCVFEGSEVVHKDLIPKLPLFESLESFDHNQLPGNYKAWMKGGRIETDTEDTTILPGRLILTCESEDYPVFRDFQVLLPAYRTQTWQALTRKSFTGGSVKMELIDPANDPLIDPTAAPLATYTLPDTADTNLPLKLGYKSDKAMLAILRVTAQNSTGTVEIDTRLIENRIQHGQ